MLYPAVRHIKTFFLQPKINELCGWSLNKKKRRQKNFSKSYRDKLELPSSPWCRCWLTDWPCKIGNWLSRGKKIPCSTHVQKFHYQWLYKYFRWRIYNLNTNYGNQAKFWSEKSAEKNYLAKTLVKTGLKSENRIEYISSYYFWLTCVNLEV